MFIIIITLSTDGDHRDNYAKAITGFGGKVVLVLPVPVKTQHLHIFACTIS